MQTYQREELWFPCSLDILAWDDAFHALMLGDQLRMEAYEAAIKRAIKPRDIVVDLGTGTGILARWACEAGAHRVYGIECNANMLDRANNTLTHLGYGERFIGLNALSYAVELPERADVIVSEIIGNLGDNEDCGRILADARQRMLAPKGRMLPQQLATYLVPVCSPNLHRQISEGVCRSVSQTQDIRQLLDALGLRSPFDTYYDAILPRSTYLSLPQPARRFDFEEDGYATDYTVALRFPANASGTLTGFKGFFVADLRNGILLNIEGDDHGIGRYSDSWKHAYLPLQQPLTVHRGDVIDVTLSRRAQNGTDSPFACRYHWKANVHSSQGIERMPA
ncbi:methyltransferase domain-containing protein [Burkholderia sp. Bp9012]|uniref:methyltransferase domain-containing protein n=1 Tax=Burkholderia sp. Bp9012 TaxID=2184562 RepID=UPI000F593BD5|nr:class I SAM-dependent methyltransferase [Burkholderia sp. Bp9012]RQR79135.1 methyltransferase domain-containing protein [Burkholderia sp. Bp9012]